jgi:hypothetical protein
MKVLLQGKIVIVGMYVCVCRVEGAAVFVLSGDSLMWLKVIFSLCWGGGEGVLYCGEWAASAIDVSICKP